MSFEVIPAVDVQDGQTVQLVGGDPETGTAYGDPGDVARRWADAGAETIHVVDLDGAFAGERVNDTALGRIRSAVGDDARLQVGGGIRTATDALDLLAGGVDRVILGTAAVEEPSIVERVSDERPGSVVVSLDARDDRVVVNGWTEETGLDPAEAAARYESLGAGAILYTDVDVEGQLAGVNADRVRRVAEQVSIPVIASGGVASVEDLLALRDAGAGAAVVGTALYEDRFTLREAHEALDA